MLKCRLRTRKHPRTTFAEVSSAIWVFTWSKATPANQRCSSNTTLPHTMAANVQHSAAPTEPKVSQKMFSHAVFLLTALGTESYMQY